MLNYFTKKEINSRTLKYINEEIYKLDYYFKESKTLNSKHQIRDKALFIRLKQKALISTFKPIKSTQDILFTQEKEDVYLAIKYLSKIDSKKIAKRANLELLLYKAILYELIDENYTAKECYMKALEFDSSSYTLKEYKTFKDRLIELKVNKLEQKSRLNINNDIDEDIHPNSAAKLESMAKYYIKSKKSLTLAQKYFKMSLDIYKELSKYNPKKYQIKYILNLIKAVEIFKMPKQTLDEAQYLIFHNNCCEQTELYILNKIHRLQERRY